MTYTIDRTTPHPDDASLYRVIGPNGPTRAWASKRAVLVGDYPTLHIVSGTFRSGTFMGGTFWGGTFRGGTFEGGTFWGGTFWGGTFWSGTFWGGTFMGGTFRGGTFWSGTFEGGTFWGGTFWGGTFRGGTFEGGTFWGGTFEGGTFWGGTFTNQPLTISRSDGYFFTLQTKNDQPAVAAGCRYFTFPEARAHWQETRAGTPLGDETFRILDFLEASLVS